MRKLISLLLAVVMVMGLATVVSAADPTDAGNHTITAEAEIPTSITLAAGETATYSFEGDAAWAVMGQTARLTGDKPGKLWLIPGMWGNDLYEGVAEGFFNGHPMQGPITLAVENTGTETATYTFTVVGPLGSIGNPDTYLDLQYPNWPNCVADGAYEYYYTYTAGNTPEIFTISDFALDYSDPTNITYNVVLTSENDEVFLFNGTSYDETVSIGLYAGETLSIMVRAAENELMQGMVSANFKASVVEAPLGAKVNPIEVSMLGDYVVSGDEVWYAVNSMLAGNVIAVQGDDASLVIGDDTITAVDGLATAVLNGEGAVIPVGVYNATDMIIMPAPTEISAAGDYTADVAAGAEVEYAVNSMLAGSVLTVEGEGAYILIGTTKYEAVDGVATAVLDGEGAVIAVKIGNASNANAQYALNIAYAPTEINAAGEFTANVAAGAEVEYAVNSKLAGAILTVKGEGAYIIVGDTKVTAVDGVASVVLDGEGATIAVVIGNAGTAAASYEAEIAYAPTSINAAGDYKVTVAPGAEVEFAVNSKLDGAVVTVKGEGAYLIVNGKKIEGKDGVVTATLSADAATISLIVGNAGTTAGEWTVNVVVAGNAQTGDIIGAVIAAFAMSGTGLTAAVVGKKRKF